MFLEHGPIVAHHLDVAFDAAFIERVDEHTERDALRGEVGGHVGDGGLCVARREPVDAPLQEDAECDGRVVVGARVVVEPVNDGPCEHVQEERGAHDEREAEQHDEVDGAAAEQNAVHQRGLTPDARQRCEERPGFAGGHHPVEGSHIEQVAESRLFRLENTSTHLQCVRGVKITLNQFVRGFIRERLLMNTSRR